MDKEIERANGARVKIAIIDSGINCNHPLIQRCKISSKSIAIHYQEARIKKSNDINDNFGHGTAVCGILAKLIPEAEFIVIKIFDHADLQAEEEQLLTALEYVINEVKCDIVHMSLGIVTYSAILHELCKKLVKQKVILISAYDNAGAISYPAAFPEVIGVDSDIRCTRWDDFLVIEGENDNITVYAKGGNHRLAWSDPQYIISQGSSFSSAYVTAYIAKMLSVGIEEKSIIYKLKKKAKKQRKIEKIDSPQLTSIPFTIHHAVIYPYNKEMHSLVNYAKNLDFKIDAVCDSKYTGRIGKKVQSLDKTSSYQIMSLEQVEWKDIDTLILGHMNELEEKIGAKLKDEVINLCIKNKINIYSFDEDDISCDKFQNEDIKIYIPRLTDVEYTKIYDGKFI